jgi:hypothetical protein
MSLGWSDLEEEEQVSEDKRDEEGGYDVGERCGEEHLAGGDRWEPQGGYGPGLVEGRCAAVEGEKGVGDVTRRGERWSGGHMSVRGESGKWKGKW